jgi:hypothetical protein
MPDVNENSTEAGGFIVEDVFGRKAEFTYMRMEVLAFAMRNTITVDDAIEKLGQRIADEIAEALSA